MESVPPRPTNLANVARLLAYAQALELERHLSRAKRGIPTLALVLVWLVLAWRGTGRPHRLELLDEPLLAALLGRARTPSARTLRRSLRYFSAKAVRRAVEAAYLAELPRRAGRVWAAVDAHQVPYWGRGNLDRFEEGWSGSYSRHLRGYRLYLAVDTDTGQVITFALTRGRTRDARLAAAFARRLRALLGRRLAGLVADCGFTSRAPVAALLATGVPFILGFARSRPIRERLAALSGPQQLAATYRQRWRVEQAIEELLNGMDLDHLVGYRLHPNRVALGFRLLARNLAVGLQIKDADGRPDRIREPAAFRAEHVDGLATFALHGAAILLAHSGPDPEATYALPWTGRTVRLVA